MNNKQQIRCYDYVNHPYQQVREAFRDDAVQFFQKATKVAASRAKTVASELRVNFGGIDIATDIQISLNKAEDRQEKLTRLRLQSCI